VVSRASGQSWPLEPPEVREKFERLALLERDNHQKAHPEYKFAPNKNQTPPKKKRAPDDDTGELNDHESDLQLMRSRSRKRTRSSEIGGGYEIRDTTPFDGRDLGLASIYNRSPWHVNNLGRSTTAPLSPPEQTHYLPSMVHPSAIGSHVEEMRYCKVELPDAQYHPTATLAGIPGNIHHDLLQTYSNVSTPSQIDDSQLDPQLLAVDHGVSDLDDACGVLGHCQYTFWQSENGPNVYLPVPSGLPSNSGPYTIGLSCYPVMQAAEDGHSVWNLNHEELAGEAGKEFDQWLNSHPTAP
jgi:hypothetical protein